MKTAAKKLFGILLIAAVRVCTLAVTVFAAETIRPAGDPLTYTVLSDGTVRITDCEDGQSSITIPRQVEGYSVTQLAGGLFRNYDSLETLTFEAGSQLKEIGEEAFAYTVKDDNTVPAVITSLTLPASLETLGESAFYCIPVENFALENYSRLTEIPDGFLAADGDDGKPGVNTEARTFWDYVISWFAQITKTPYPFTPAKVAEACDCLVNIDLGDHNSLARIGMGAFKNQTHLTEIDFGENAAASGLEIKHGAFVGVGLNKGIETLVFPANLEYIL